MVYHRHAVQHIENIFFLKCFLLQTVVVLHYTLSYKNGMLGQREEGCQNAHQSSLVANFAQTCSLISIYNGMYTVCSYDTS